MDLNPDSEDGTFDFTFQVWRPSPTVNVTGCYSLVDDFTTSSITITPSEPVARVVPSRQDQLPFQPGDVLGFYVERHGGESFYNDGVVVLIDASHTSELVWYASVDIRAAAVQPSQSARCPYPVGTNGVLSSSTHAAPVISVALITTPCSNTPLHVATTSFIFSNYPTSANVNLPTPTVTITSHYDHNPVTTATVVSFQFSTSTSLISSSFTHLNSRSSTAIRFLVHPTSTSLATNEIYTIPYSEDRSSSLSTFQVVGISVMALAGAVLLTAAAATVLCCVKRYNYCNRKNTPPLHAPSDGNTRKQSTIPLKEDYPDVVASMQLNDNQAYGNLSYSTSIVKDTKVDHDPALSSSSSSIKVQGNEAYAALDLLS